MLNVLFALLFLFASLCEGHTLHARIRRLVPRSSWGPTLSPVHYDSIVRTTGCNPFSTESFFPSIDDRCSRYMSDRSNWNDVSPITFTAKNTELKYHNQFLVRFKSPGLLAILKPPKRRHHGLEPDNEYTAYRLDRLLHMNYVPPMTWVDVPFAVFREAIYRNSTLTATIFKNMTIGDRLEGFLVNYTRDQGLTRHDPDGQEVLPSLIILWMHGMQRLDRTALRFPPSELYDHMWWRMFHPRWRPNLTETPLLAVSLSHHSDLFIFDHLCNNPDRDPDNNLFALEGCLPACTSDFLPHPGPPEFLHADHGRSFHPNFTRHLPHNPFSARLRERSRLCFFQRATVRRLRYIAAREGLASRLWRSLPLEVARRMASLALVDERLRAVLDRVDRCIFKYGEAQVIHS